MDLKPSLLSYFFTRSANWKLSYTFPEVKLDINKQTTHLTLDEILDVNIRSGWVWSSITLSTVEQNYVLKGIFNSQAKILKSNILDDIEFLNNKKNADTLKETLKPYLVEYQNFIQQNIYLSHRLCSLFRSDLSERVKAFVEKFSKLIERDSSFAFEADLQNLFEQLRQFIELPIKANYAIDAKNKCFIESELKVFKSFFDQVESTPLTNEQRIILNNN